MLTAANFGRELVRTKDLDPLYVMLNAAGLDWSTRARFCLAYWMFYHAGVAARIAEPDEDFWEGCWLAYENKWPRGTERRHFRGELARSSIAALWMMNQTPEHIVACIAGAAERQSYSEVKTRVMQLRGFGPWIAFKVADMIDAVLDTEVDFRGAERDFYDSPLKGGCWVAMMTMGMGFDQVTFNRKYDEATAATRMVHTKAALNYLAAELGTMICPHNPTRTLRLQEYETILCKYKSHLNGHYEVGTDTRHLDQQLAEWENKCVLAGTLRRAI